ncbi:MAG: nucleotidyltransferase [Chloroflexota bacterium]
MEEVIRAIAHALHSTKTQYVVIGGIAASIWGRPRMTLDVDIVVVLLPEELSHFLESLAQSGFQVSPSAMRKLLRALPTKVRYGKRLSVDLRMASYTLDRQALERATPVRVLGTSLRIASKEDIIAYKVARFEDLDRADIKSIILRHRKKIDATYLVTACRQLAQETGDARISDNMDVVLSWL